MSAPKIALAIVTGLLSVSVFASSECTKLPAEKWLSEKEVKAKLEKAGVTVERIKREGSCDEVKGTRKDGKRVELYVSPVDASIVKEEVK